MTKSISLQEKETGIIVLLIILLFPFIQQRTYADLPFGYASKITAFYRYTSFLAATCVYVISLREKRLLEGAKYLWLIAAFWSVYLISTYLNDRSFLTSMFIIAYSQFALVLLITIAARKWHYKLFAALSFLYGGWILLNFILDILYPDGLYHTITYHSAHLLGDDNALVYVMLPGLTLIVCNSYLRRKRIDVKSWLLIIIVSFTLLRIWAVSAFLSVLLFIGLLLYILIFKRINTSLLLIGLVSVIIICFVGLSNPTISDFIEYKLDKDITLSGRTILWLNALIEIMDKPVLGYGGFFEYGRWYISDGSIEEYPCHTPYLQLLLDGGLILFSFFIMIVIIANLKINKNSNNIIGYILAAGLISMMFNYITEWSKFHHFFIITTIMLNIEYIKPSIKYLYETDSK